MTGFDRSQPYAEVYGQPGIAFQQNGVSFNGRGEPVTDFASLKPAYFEPPEVFDDGAIPRFYVQESETHTHEVSQDIEKLHWKKLQQMLSIYGETFVSREHAISFLKGQK